MQYLLFSFVGPIGADTELLIIIEKPFRAASAAIPHMTDQGITSCIGIQYGKGASISFDANDFLFKKLQLRASHAAPALYFPLVLQLLRDKQINGDALIPHEAPLAQLAATMYLVRDRPNEVVRVVSTP